jgi:hypothetical protein
MGEDEVVRKGKIANGRTGGQPMKSYPSLEEGVFPLEMGGKDGCQ